MRAADSQPRYAAGDILPFHEFPERGLCPRGRAMLDTARDILTREGAVTETELRMAGYSYDEIIEYAPKVQAALREEHCPPPDRFPQLADRFRSAIPALPPMMAGNNLTVEQLSLWRTYCRALAALKVDPTNGQRMRVFGLADQYVRTLPLIPSETRSLQNAITRHLARFVTTADAS